MNTVSVTYHGVRLTCAYEYDPPEPRTWEEPGCPANATLNECKIADVDIYEMLSSAQVDEIEGLILEAKGEQDEADAGEYADMRRNERLMETGYP